MFFTAVKVSLFRNTAKCLPAAGIFPSDAHLQNLNAAVSSMENGRMYVPDIR